MKKRLIFFFLALLCLVGSGIYLYGERVAHPESHQSVPAGTDAAIPGASGEPAPVVIMGEVIHLGEAPKTYISFDMDYMVKSTVGPHLIHEKMDYMMPSMFHGSDPARSSIFQWVSPPISRSAYLTISQNSNPLIDRFLVMPGDTVQIKFDLLRGMQMFYGPAAQNFKCQYELKLAKENHNYSLSPAMVVDNVEVFLSDSTRGSMFQKSRGWPGRKLNLFEGKEKEVVWIDSMFSVKKTGREAILDNYKGQIPEPAFQLLKIQLWTERYGALYRMGVAYKIAQTQNDTLTLQRLNEIFERHLSNPVPKEFDERLLSQSSAFMDYIRSWSQAKKLGFQLPMLEVLNEIPSKVIRDRAIGGYFLASHKHISGLDQEILKAMDIVDDIHIMDFLDGLLFERGSGAKMPDFSFSDPDGNQRRLSEFEDKVVLLDFWFTGCKPCIWFYTEVLQEVEAHFKEEEDFQIISISVDSRKDVWLKSMEGGNYTSPEVVNLYTDGMGAKHPYLTENKISGFPNHLLLTKGGQVFLSGQIPKDPDSLIQLINTALDL